jgi:hypothetical protein
MVVARFIILYLAIVGFASPVENRSGIYLGDGSDYGVAELGYEGRGTGGLGDL